LSKLPDLIDALGEFLDLVRDWEGSRGFDRLIALSVSLAFFYGTVVFVTGFWQHPFFFLATVSGLIGVLDLAIRMAGHWRRT
jgi:hypothetical protein